MEDLNISNLKIPNYKEYNIKKENEIYNLRIEIKEQNIISFTITKLNEEFYFIYKNQIKIISLLEKVNLNEINKDSIFILFDEIYRNNNILINQYDNNHINLLIIKTNSPDNPKFEINLNKQQMTMENKFNLLFNQINLIKNEKINFLYNDIYKKEDDIKNIINEKDIIIQKMNETILKQDFIIKEHKNEIYSIKKKIEEIIINFAEEKKEKGDMLNQINNQLSKQENQISDINSKIKKIDENETQMKKDIDYNILREKEKLLNIIIDKFYELNIMIDDIN